MMGLFVNGLCASFVFLYAWACFHSAVLMRFHSGQATKEEHSEENQLGHCFKRLSMIQLSQRLMRLCLSLCSRQWRQTLQSVCYPTVLQLLPSVFAPSLTDPRFEDCSLLAHLLLFWLLFVSAWTCRETTTRVMPLDSSGLMLSG